MCWCSWCCGERGSGRPTAALVPDGWYGTGWNRPSYRTRGIGQGSLVSICSAGLPRRRSSAGRPATDWGIASCRMPHASTLDTGSCACEAQGVGGIGVGCCHAHSSSAPPRSAVDSSGVCMHAGRQDGRTVGRWGGGTVGLWACGCPWSLNTTLQVVHSST